MVQLRDKIGILLTVLKRFIYCEIAKYSYSLQSHTIIREIQYKHRFKKCDTI